MENKVEHNKEEAEEVEEVEEEAVVEEVQDCNC